MRRAITQEGKKIYPYPGGRAFCPECNGVVIAKCGELVVDHWSHENLEDCDTWKYEPITQWHLDWQSHFPEDNVEVTIKKGGFCHRADIKTDKGTIIEIQNSQISTDDIRNRECFYGEKMIWVINANDFFHQVSFKDYPVDVSGLWFRFILPFEEDEQNSNYAIKVPFDDFMNFIKPALMEAEFIKSDETTSDGYELWYGYKKHYSDDKLPDKVYQAFHQYILYEKLMLSESIETGKHFGTSFRWKHLRKSWTVSNNPKFFDLNNGYLFWIKRLYENGNGFGKFVMKKNFIKHYKSAK